MNITSSEKNRWTFIFIISILTVLFHYIYGTSHVAILEVIHRRLCYIPIVLAGVWFGVSGGIGIALLISIAVIPFIYLHRKVPHDFIASEVVEILFYIIIGWITGILSDAQRAMQRKNEILQEQLKTSERLSAVGELFAYIIHEIKNPLNSLKGAYDIVMDPSVNNQQRKEFSAILKNEIIRLNHILDSMLSYTRLKLNIEQCDIKWHLINVINLLSVAANTSNVRVSLTVTDNPIIYADCDKIKQVFVNLILNAIEAMPLGGELFVKVLQTDNDYIDIQFIDTGNGISPDNIPKLFKPLFTTKKTGTGLGLAISKRIIDEHKGKLFVKSTQGKGSTFTVRLPCNQ